MLALLIMVVAMTVVGYVGGIITTAGGIPQLSKMFKTKQTKDISWTMLAMWSLGLLLTTIYGAAVNQPPVYTSSSISMFMTLAMIALKFRYDEPIYISLDTNV